MGALAAPDLARLVSMSRYARSPDYGDVFPPAAGMMTARRLRMLMLKRIESVHGVEVRNDIDRSLEVRDAYKAADSLMALLRSSQFAFKLDTPPSPEVVTEEATRYRHVPASWWDHLKATVRDRFGAWMDRNLPPGRPPVALRKDVAAIQVKTTPVPAAVTVRRETHVKARYHACPHVGKDVKDCVRFLNVPAGEDGTDQRLLAHVKALASVAVAAYQVDRSVMGYYPPEQHLRFANAMQHLQCLLNDRP